MATTGVVYFLVTALLSMLAFFLGIVAARRTA